MNQALKIAAKTDDEKLDVFKQRLCALYSCELDTLKILFSNRPSDPMMLSYDEKLTRFAISFDGEKWKSNTIGTFEQHGAVPIPLRGSVWKSIKSYEFFIIVDFANLRSPKPKEEPPYVVYMDVNGNTKTMHVVTWFQNMISHNKKLV